MYVIVYIYIYYTLHYMSHTTTTPKADSMIKETIGTRN